MCRRPRRLSSQLEPARIVQLADKRERLRHDLIHVVVLVGAQPTDELDAGRDLGQRLVPFVERRVLGARDRIVRSPSAWGYS